jgi:excisionase family DNA binding protein
VTERLLTAAELAERLNVPPGWPLEQARAGNIPHLRLGRYVRFEWGEVAAWLESVKAGGGPHFRKYRPGGELRGSCALLAEAIDEAAA